MKWKVMECYTPRNRDFQNVSYIYEGEFPKGAVWYDPHRNTWVYGCSNCDECEESTDNEESAKSLLVVHIRMECRENK